MLLPFKSAEPTSVSTPYYSACSTDSTAGCLPLHSSRVGSAHCAELRADWFNSVSACYFAWSLSGEKSSPSSFWTHLFTTCSRRSRRLKFERGAYRWALLGYQYFNSLAGIQKDGRASFVSMYYLEISTSSNKFMFYWVGHCL